MKKLLITMVLLSGCFAGQVMAQQLFETVHKEATKVVNNPSSSEEAIQVNQFKVTVLNYIATQVQKRGLQKDGYFYDSQAVNLQSFVLDFLTYINKARVISPAKRMEVIKCFRDASLQNPLFNDTDKERAYCYVNDKQTLTPFSLDTDWDKAYEQVSVNIKKVLP
ncbi:MAG: hypothetical protein IKG96_09580 [Bacteroidaceae bacterium]|nr:hypothetical protein [Bacteroidaceae bacterium]MBR3443890.1 hypothetical protein [Bacteroidaceae bacterium]